MGFNKIDEYLAGRLAAEEKKQIEAAIGQDTALASAVRTARMEREALDLLSEEKARTDFMRWTEGIAEESDVPVSVLSWSRIRWYMSGVAAIFVLLFAVWYFGSDKNNTEVVETIPVEQPPQTTPIQPKVHGQELTEEIAIEPKRTPPDLPSTDHLPGKSQDVYVAAWEMEAKNEFSEPKEEALSRLRGSGSFDTPFLAAINAYETAKNKIDYTKAGELLNKIEPNHSKYWLAVYLKAHAWFMSGQYEKAADAFRDVAAKRMPYSPDAKWKEALSLYALGGKQKQRLKEILEKVSSPEEQLKAKDILIKLK